MKVRLSLYNHNRIFRYRQVKLLTYYEIVDNPQEPDIYMYEYIRFPVRVLGIILSPLAIFVGGYPAMLSLVKECLSRKSVGADTINREWFYKELKGLLT